MHPTPSIFRNTPHPIPITQTSRQRLLLLPILIISIISASHPRTSEITVLTAAMRLGLVVGVGGAVRLRGRGGVVDVVLIKGRWGAGSRGVVGVVGIGVEGVGIWVGHGGRLLRSDEGQ